MPTLSSLCREGPRSTIHDPRAPRVLVRRVCGLGDLILTLPFLKALPGVHPGAAIHMIGHQEHLELLLTAGCISQGFGEQHSGWHLLFEGPDVPWERLRPDPRGYDRVYLFVRDPQRSPLLHSLAKALGERVLAIPTRPPSGAPIHAAMNPLIALGARPSEPQLVREPLLKLNGECAGGAGLAIEERSPAGLQPILVHPGSGSPKKNWPADRFAELLKRILIAFPRLRPWLIQGPADGSPVEALVHDLGPNAGVQVVTALRVAGLASALREGSLFIGNDSGVTHLCAALGVPTVAIFGPSDPAQWSPLGPRVRVLYRDGDCLPCHLVREMHCARPVCERFPSVDEVERAVVDLLRPGDPPIP
jgi:heptosyltransferase-3